MTARYVFQSLGGRVLLARCAALAIGAACVGGVYNSASPLGVRAAPASGGPMDSTAAGGHGANASAGVASPYSNQSLAITTQAPQAGAASGAALVNETMSIEIVGGLPQSPAALRIPTTMTWPQVKAMLAAGSIILIDARDLVSFDAGHIPGAVSFPANSMNVRLAEFMAKFSKSKPIVVYCASAKCPLSKSMAQTLMQQGYEDVRDMPGGFAEWRIVEGDSTNHLGGGP